MQKTVVIDIVGLSESVISEYTPFLKSYIAKNHISKIKPVLPAVTTSSQSVYVTGKYPKDHGIVGNGWYDSTDAEVKFWKQSNHLVGAEKVWDEAKKETQPSPVRRCFGGITCILPRIIPSRPALNITKMASKHRIVIPTRQNLETSCRPN